MIASYPNPGENSREPSKAASYSPFLWSGMLVWLTALISVSCAMNLVSAQEATFAFELTAADLQELDRVTSEIAVEGDRYPPDIERMNGRISPRLEGVSIVDVATKLSESAWKRRAAS